MLSCYTRFLTFLYALLKALGFLACFTLSLRSFQGSCVLEAKLLFLTSLHCPATVLLISFSLNLRLPAPCLASSKTQKVFLFSLSSPFLKTHTLSALSSCSFTVLRPASLQASSYGLSPGHPDSSSLLFSLYITFKSGVAASAEPIPSE